MRLLNTATYKLEEFGSDIPLYAILSHTWGEHEITFQDIESIDVEKMAEYEKIRNTCSVAATHGFNYVWIDTCCIDKTSSAELSEAINSMYRWYQESSVCYAYLADVPPNTIDHQTLVIGPKFSESKWFTRGWTLQELIAPSTVIFLDQEWQEIGTKLSLQRTVSEITGIPANILLRGDLECASVAQRMSWASKRKTTRVEDLAYCLMGIFGVHMPMIYGEGERAFIRLQEEIIKISDDYSLFAWESFDSRGGILATSPAAFSNSSKLIPVNSSSTLSGAITVNNKGIHLNLRFMDMDRTSFQDVTLAIIPCTVEGSERKRVAIYVRAISETMVYFVRVKSDRFELLNFKDFSTLKYCEKSICVRQERLARKNHLPLSKAAAHGNEAVVTMLLEKGVDLESSDSKHSRTPLLLAAENGHERVVRLLLEQGASLESRDSTYDQTPLSLAAENGHEAVVKLLLEKGADPKSESSRSGQTPLLWAAQRGHERAAKLLVEKGADLESKDSTYGQTPLSLAAENGHEAVVKLLLEKGADLESKDSMYGQTPLSLAAENGHEVVVKLLLEKGANLESKDSKDLQTPLSLAAENGHGAVVKLLLKKGAELESRDSRFGWTPLSFAVRRGHDVVARVLLKKGANIESRDSRFGQTPLSLATRKGHEEVSKLLLDKGADWESKDTTYGQTPLSLAAENGQERVVRLLIEKGAELESGDSSYGQTPLSLAAENGYEAVVKLLVEKGANIESKDFKDGRTPLLWAARKGHEAVVKLLLEKGANIESKDSKYGRTPLSLAAENGHEAVVIMLLEKGVQKSLALES